MVRTVARRTAPPSPLLTKTALVSRLKKWSLIKRETADLTKEQNNLRDEMMKYAETLAAQAEQDGDPEGDIEFDEKGSIYIPLPSFDGPNGRVSGFKRERRVSTVFDEDKALALLEAKGDPKLKKRAIRTIEVIDQDEFYVLQQEGLITEPELDSLFEEKVNWAFHPVQG